MSLRKSLEEMGMLEAFGDKLAYRDRLGTADFTGLAADPSPPGQPCPAILQIDDVLQKAMIAVIESGVEAAAATAVSIGTVINISGGNPSVPVVVDRPFLVAIVDAPTGAVLFLGHIQDPTDTGGP
jgi:serpin B